MNLNLQSVKEKFVTFKQEHIDPMPKRMKRLMVGGIAGVVIIAVVAAVALNMGKMGYTVLYHDLSTEETQSVYAMLQDLGVEAKLDTEGNITVPSKDYDKALIELATKGYPQSALNYGLFESHSGMTATESENKQWRLYQLQDRIQATLKQIDPIKSAVVTIDVPDSSTYVWEKSDESEQSKASVLLNLSSDISAQQVTAIKNLVSSSVPKLEPENVTVVDAATGKQLSGTDDAGNDTITAQDNLEFERQVQDQIEDNARRVLIPRYGSDGVVAVAKVTLDYDKMMTEEMQLKEKDGGGGYVTDFSEQYSLDGTEPANGIVGEENNTDIPQQQYEDDAGQPADNTTNYSRDIKYDYGYVKTQVEKGNAQLKDASISVMVDESQLSANRKNEIVDLVAKSTGIAADKISVASMKPDATQNTDDTVTPATSQTISLANIPVWVWGIVAGLILVIIIIVLIRKRRAKKQRMLQEEQQREIDQQREQMENEIAAYKKQLSDAAMAATDPKDSAIMKEVQDFAKENPEITANLLRAWMKEEE